MERKQNPYLKNSDDWMALLRNEHTEEVKAEARWPTVMLQSSARQIVWSMCSLLGVYDKGVPGSSCRLLERCLCRHIQTFLHENHSLEEFSQYKKVIVSKFFLLLVSCVQLAAKMSDLQTPMSASRVRSALLQLGVDHSTAEIVRMESRVFGILDYRIPVWNSLETAEFLADGVGVNSPVIIKALEVVINATEYRRDIFELNMKSWIAHNRPANVSPPSEEGSAVRLTMHNLHVCAAGVAATLRYMQHPARAAAVLALARLLPVERAYLRAMVHALLKTIFTPLEPSASGSKKKRYL
ncbi:hypothetical protein PYW08_000170 [Mythimna loreyi]|uniref:Uncharacterized protein n=1 Tax=Mythimna loreyi TaxID=667449 RepID=A0ACC2RBL9_9NEOP|nr:hypothetical protein PYW08_000170 [Mythimna loreyi]